MKTARSYWEAWCYRCHERKAGTADSETASRERIADFKRQHQTKCGASAAVGSQTGVR
jgi:hypothetical protein